MHLREVVERRRDRVGRLRHLPRVVPRCLRHAVLISERRLDAPAVPEGVHMHGVRQQSLRAEGGQVSRTHVLIKITLAFKGCSDVLFPKNGAFVQFVSLRLCSARSAQSSKQSRYLRANDRFRSLNRVRNARSSSTRSTCPAVMRTAVGSFALGARGSLSSLGVEAPPVAYSCVPRLGFCGARA